MKISTIAIIGAGRFGKSLALILPSIFPRVEIRIVRRNLLRALDADIIIPAVPIREFEYVIESLSPTLKQGQIVMDVCSVKIFPANIMLKHIPSYVQIIASHPMFGPGTLAKTKGSVKGLKIMMDAIRVNPDSEKYIKNAFRKGGMDVVSMTSDEHDRYAAQFHFSSQFVASVLKDLQIQKTPIDTASVGVLHNFIEFVQTDTRTLLQDMYRYNPYCKKQLEQIVLSFEQLARTIEQ